MKKNFGMMAGPFEIKAAYRVVETQDMSGKSSLGLRWGFETDTPNIHRRNDERKIWRRLFG